MNGVHVHQRRQRSGALHLLLRVEREAEDGECPEAIGHENVVQQLAHVRIRGGHG